MFGLFKKKKEVEIVEEKIRNKYLVTITLKSQPEPLPIICINESKADLGEWLSYLLGSKKCFYSNLTDGNIRLTKCNDVVSMLIEDYVELEEVK